jgi:aminoglycoside phosphotransferase (APT) family kinase protein
MMSLLDIGRLTAWLDGRELERGKPLGAEPLAGGRSNAMFALRRGSARWVLRRPARIAVDRANEGMRREFRFLAALAGTAVPHPVAIALCEDHDVLGCTFFIMEHVEGVHALPAPPAFDDESGRYEVGIALIDALAQLHDVDWRSAGLADLGRPNGFHERQVKRWSAQLDSYNGREIPGIGDVMLWLGEHRPATFEPTIMHGDYHVINALIAPDRPGRVVAILDWETATIGDPLLDLAGFCEIWSEIAGQANPTRAALVERYQAERGLGPIQEMTYYIVLYNFRLAVLLEGIYQRSLRDPSREPQHDIGRRALANVDRALAIVRDESG